MSEMREGESILSTTLELLSETMASMSLLMASMAMLLRGDPSEAELAEKTAKMALESSVMKLQRARAAIGPVESNQSDETRYCADPLCGVAMMESSDGSSFWCPRCGTVSVVAYEIEPENLCQCGRATMVPKPHGGLECPQCGRVKRLVGKRIIDYREAPGA